MPRMHYTIRPGDIFGELTVIKSVRLRANGPRKGFRLRYMCKCSCGATLLVEGYRIASGHKKSCGCLQPLAASLSGAKRKIHGCASNKARTPEYMVWVRMRNRCENPNNQDYPGYGGRGIKVCERWNSFTNFISDMGNRPKGRYYIDRIDNNSGYSPNNCRWVTAKESNRNKRSIKLLEVDGVVKGLSEWAEEAGIDLETIRSRIRRGWAEKSAIFEPIKQVMEKVGKRWGSRIPQEVGDEKEKNA